MKKFFSILTLVALMTTGIMAQSEYKAANEGWLVSVDEAYQLSQKTGKPIMANFTGSDWCGWCKRLTANVFSKDEFKSWAKDNVVLLEIDKPRRFQLPQNIAYQNQNFMQAFGISGFPTVWVFSLSKADAKSSYNIEPIARTSYKPTVEEFISSISSELASFKKS